MKTVSIFCLLAVLTSMAVALTADPKLFAEVNSWVNPSGISYTKIPHDFSQSGARGIELVAPVYPSDFQFFALNSTIATRDISDSIELLNIGNIFINCTISTNYRGEQNWIWVNFNETSVTFYAYGDAAAAFSTFSSTQQTSSNRKRHYAATTTITQSPAVSVNYTDYGSILNPNSIINPYCPPTTVTNKRRRNGGDGLFGRSRF